MTPRNRRNMELNILLTGIAIKKAELMKDVYKQNTMIEQLLIKAAEWEILDRLDLIYEANEKFTLVELEGFLDMVKRKFIN